MKKEAAPEPVPSFQPELQRTRLGQELAAARPSSGYGKKPAVLPAHPAPERPTFQPDLGPQRSHAASLRETVGSRAIKDAERHAAERAAMEPVATAHEPYVPRHTLLADKIPEMPRAPSPVFTLDCVRSCCVGAGGV